MQSISHSDKLTIGYFRLPGTMWGCVDETGWAGQGRGVTIDQVGHVSWLSAEAVKQVYLGYPRTETLRVPPIVRAKARGFLLCPDICCVCPSCRALVVDAVGSALLWQMGVRDA